MLRVYSKPQIIDIVIPVDGQGYNVTGIGDLDSKILTAAIRPLDKGQKVDERIKLQIEQELKEKGYLGCKILLSYYRPMQEQ